MTDDADTDPALDRFTKPEKLSDAALYDAYQRGKRHGPAARVGELEREIIRRWETDIENAGLARDIERVEYDPDDHDETPPK